MSNTIKRQQRSEKRMLSEEWIRSTMELAHNMVQAYSDMEHDTENDQLLNWNRAQRQMRVRLMAAAEQIERMREDNERLAREAYTWSKAAETYAAELERLRAAAQQARAALEQADLSTGYCCCGSSMDMHGLTDNHSPVDEGAYFQGKILEQLQEALKETP